MYLDDMSIGAEMRVSGALIDAEKMIAFAKEYDPFPFHYDEEAAAQTRFGRIIAPGIMSFMTVWKKFVETGFFGDELVAGQRTTVEWYKPVFIGDELSATVTISNIERRNPYNGLLTLEFKVYNQQQLLVLGSKVESIVKYHR